MNIWKNIKGKIKDIKDESIYRNAASKQIKKKATAAYYQASLKERIKYAQEKAKIEREQKIKKLKESYKPKKEGRLTKLKQDLSKGFNQGFNQGYSMFSGVSEPYFKPKPKRKKNKRTWLN